MEEFEEFMAEMLEEYNYDEDTVMVTTAFAQALANEWCKKQLTLTDVVWANPNSCFVLVVVEK